MALKDLVYKIKYDINDKDLKNVEKNVVEAEEEVKDLGNEFKKVNEETKKLDKNTKDVNKGFSTLKDIMTSKAISYGIGLVGKGMRGAKNLTMDLLQTASDGLESIAKFEIVFGDLSDATFKWIDDISALIGRGKGDLRGYLADTQTLLFGYTDQSEKMRKVTAEMSKDITRFALDLAAMNDVADDDAINRLQSGLVGNHMALKNLGIALTESTLKMTMQNLGIKGNFKDLDELTKIQIRYITALEQSQTTIGHAERESKDYASQVKLLEGTITDIKEELGVELIPVAIDFIGIIKDNKDVIVDLGKQFVDFVGTKGKDLADWFKDKDNVNDFKDSLLKVGEAIFYIADGVVWLATKIGLLIDKFRDFKEVEQSRKDYFTKEAGGNEILGIMNKSLDDTLRMFTGQSILGTKGFKRGTTRTPDTFIAGEDGPELITGSPNMRVFNNKDTQEIFNNTTNRVEKISSQISINVPIKINNNRKVVNGEMRAEIENFFGELLVKYGYVEV